MADQYEGRTQTSKDGQRRQVWRSGQWVNDDTYVPPPPKVKTTTQDMKLLADSSAKAKAEREFRRTIPGTRKAVDNFGPSGTGPLTAWYLDAITPSDGGDGFFGGIADSIGATLGAPLRSLVSQKTWNARDRLKTVNAQAALAGSEKLKGAASDRDMALLRTTGVGPYKMPAENHRLLNQADYRSGLEEARAEVTSDWIKTHRSIANPAANGLSYEQAMQIAEERYADHYRSFKAGKGKALPRRPKSSPGKARAPITYDMNGNIIR